jgi:hypothetical protein
MKKGACRLRPVSQSNESGQKFVTALMTTRFKFRTSHLPCCNSFLTFSFSLSQSILLHRLYTICWSVAIAIEHFLYTSVLREITFSLSHPILLHSLYSICWSVAIAIETFSTPGTFMHKQHVLREKKMHTAVTQERCVRVPSPLPENCAPFSLPLP